jgi:hypothetical protein
MDDTSMQEVIERLQELLTDAPGAPTADQLAEICEVLYTASLLKEEGRPVRARVMLASPELFLASDGPPEGTHAIRFEVSHPLNANEIKRLSPAANFLHSVIAVWPGRERGLRIWGILNTGPRWQNTLSGGRKPVGKEIPYPLVHVRDPGWLLFYSGYEFLAEWRGQQFHGPRLDVFQSRMLSERFAGHRRRMVGNLIDSCLPATLSLDTYARLAHMVSLQFVKRIINLVRTSGHGGSLVFLPEDVEGTEAAVRWIDCKYPTAPGVAAERFGGLLQAILRRVGELADPGATLDDAWDVFQTTTDLELERLEEAFFELARLFSDLMQVDGALVLDKRARLIGFGGEIRVDRNVLQVGHAQDLEGGILLPWDVQSDGTRHRSVYRLCSVEPEVIGFVISQDSSVRLIANIDDAVIFWEHTMV